MEMRGRPGEILIWRGVGAPWAPSTTTSEAMTEAELAQTAVSGVFVGVDQVGWEGKKEWGELLWVPSACAHWRSWAVLGHA